jgi:hypothetical protein
MKDGWLMYRVKAQGAKWCGIRDLHPGVVWGGLYFCSEGLTWCKGRALK